MRRRTLFTKFCCFFLWGGQALASAVTSITPTAVVVDNGTTGTIKLCLTDATNKGISGVHLNWGNYTGGTVEIGGASTSPVPVPTGSNGCVQTTIWANSVPPNQSTDYLQFTAPIPYQSATPAELSLSATWALKASPTSIPASGTSAVTLTLSSYGFPQPGVLIVASCSSSGGAGVSLTNSAFSTNSSGQAGFSLTPLGVTSSSSGVACSFTTPFPDAVSPATVTISAPPPQPDHLAFGVQPSDMPQGEQLQGVVVEVLKGGSNALDTADNTTQITLNTATSVCGQFAAFGPVNVVNGIAHFSNVGPRFYSITNSPLRLVASSNPKLAGASSGTFNVVADSVDFIFAGGMENCSL